MTEELKVILIMGTFCNPENMREIRSMLRSRWQTSAKIICWTKDERKSATFSYGDVKDWNVPQKRYDLAIGHSAGGFPLAVAPNVTQKLAVNPAYPVATYPIFHARSDWLVPTHDLHGSSTIIHYNGGHSDMPIDELKTYIIGWFERMSEVDSRLRRIHQNYLNNVAPVYPPYEETPPKQSRLAKEAEAHYKAAKQRRHNRNE